MYSKGRIFNIQRFSTSDGPGIRTVVFFKGCPLDCAWCHNPESKSIFSEIFYKSELCLNCTACSMVCSKTNHLFEEGHFFNRGDCIACGRCAEICPSKALELCGEEKCTEQIINTVLKDKPFYDETGGGITLSGGEPLMQYDYSLSILKSAKERGLRTAIETSGYTNKNLFELNRYTDLWLYDIKIFDNAEHIKYTGVSNEIIFKNLFFLDSIGAKIILRCPIIPQINFTAAHFNKIAELSNNLKNVKAIHLEAYHPLGISKANQLNKYQDYQNVNFLERSKIEPCAEALREKTNVEVLVI